MIFVQNLKRHILNKTEKAKQRAKKYFTQASKCAVIVKNPQFLSNDYEIIPNCTNDKLKINLSLAFIDTDRKGCFFMNAKDL